MHLSTNNTLYSFSKSNGISIVEGDTIYEPERLVNAYKNASSLKDKREIRQSYEQIVSRLNADAGFKRWSTTI